MKPGDHEYSVVITTVASLTDAEAIIKPLLSGQLVACVQVFPIASYYTWEGAQAQEQEHILLIKALARLYPDIERSIRAHHKYEIPEIVQLPIVAGSTAYLAWMKEVSRS
jgi:periplasmic divalent cation tolerance protein